MASSSSIASKRENSTIARGTKFLNILPSRFSKQDVVKDFFFHETSSRLLICGYKQNKKDKTSIKPTTTLSEGNNKNMLQAFNVNITNSLFTENQKVLQQKSNIGKTTERLKFKH